MKWYFKLVILVSIMLTIVVAIFYGQLRQDYEDMLLLHKLMDEEITDYIVENSNLKEENATLLLDLDDIQKKLNTSERDYRFVSGLLEEAQDEIANYTLESAYERLDRALLNNCLVYNQLLLRIGQSEYEVKKIFGAPIEEKSLENEGVSKVLEGKKSVYEDFVIIYERNDVDSTYTIFGIRTTNPTLKTLKDISVGSTYKDFQSMYQDPVIDFSTDTNERYYLELFDFFGGIEIIVEDGVIAELAVTRTLP